MNSIKRFFGCHSTVHPLLDITEDDQQNTPISHRLFERTLSSWVREDTESLNDYNNARISSKDRLRDRQGLAGSITNTYVSKGTYLHTRALDVRKIMRLIGSLESLTILNIYLCKISSNGVMPESICNLTNLDKLNLTVCGLTSISKKIENLTKLTQLCLAGNHLSSFPVYICELRNLEDLNLNNTHITEIPENLGNLTKLKKLNLSSNALRSFPQTLSNLTLLQELRIINCSMSTFPEEICRITNLYRLDLDKNQLTDFPESLSQFNLKMLFLSHNGLVSLPDAITNLSQLTYLNLSNNELRTLPETIGRLSTLGQILLSENPHLQSLPISLSNCTSLNFIDLTPGLQDGLRAQVNAILGRSQDVRMLDGVVTLPTRITSWVRYCGAVYNESDYSFIFNGFSKEEQGQIGEWLLRLEGCRDFRSNNKKLAILICDILKSLQSQEFKNTFFCLVADNLTACGDRAGMLLNLIYTDWQLHKLSEDSQATDKDKILLMKGVAKTMVLRNTVDSMIKKFEKDTRDNLTEDVEIRLYFEVTLKEALGLVTAIDEMGYEIIGKRHDVVNENKLKKIVNDTFLHVFYELTSLEQFISKHKQHGTEYISKKEKIKVLAVSKLENISKKNDEGFYTNFEDYGFACGKVQQQLNQDIVNLRKHYIDILEV